MPEPVDQPVGSGAGGAPTCPRCGREDWVSGVSAAYLAASSELRTESGRGEDSSVTTREENSAMARALSPAPPEPSGNARSCTASGCGTVHFSGEPGLTLQEFRTRVWTAGGYGDLVRKHPAV
ncbi:hypothetical protein [Streptomyces sp. NPDC051183]|uniref:hypothetical protein n=1 Tax=Streptomyces sp. NPDC051183 TaxID=3155165 RepID=UPI00343BB1B9